MMRKGVVSVILPIYNVEKYLNRCVKSIVNQSYKNLEIILVDDGSPDNCPTLCEDWAKRDSRIKKWILDSLCSRISRMMVYSTH